MTNPISKEAECKAKPGLCTGPFESWRRLDRTVLFPGIACRAAVLAGIPRWLWLLLAAVAQNVVPAHSAPTFSDANWSALGSGMNSYVYALAASSNELFAGGLFTVAGGGTANHVAKWNGSNWMPLGSGMNSNVQALAVIGRDLYAAGFFTTAGGAAANYIAKWDGSAWTPLGTGMNADVDTLAVSGTNLYAGGRFTTAGGSPANYVATWNGSSWSALGAGPASYVYHALAALSNNLYAVVGENVLVKWDGARWSQVAFLNGTLAALAVSGSDLYAGGAFTTVDGTAANRVAKWNGSTWTALGFGVNNYVSTLAVSDGDLYVGGVFTNASGVAANRIAKWNGSEWAALGSGMNGSVNALTVSGGDLYAGGTFTSAGGKPSAYVAKATILPFWLTVTTNGSGKVAVSPGQSSYQTNSFVTLIATPDAGWSFTGWSGDASGTNNPLTVVMSGDRSVTANFAAPPATRMVFDNFDPNGRFHPTDNIVAAHVSIETLPPYGTNAIRAAAQFTVSGGDFRLTSITLPISVQNTVPGDFLRLRLATDAGGVPGPTLEVLSHNQPIWPAFANPFTATTTLSSASHPLLSNGQKYWLVTEPTSIPLASRVIVDYRWFLNTNGASVPVRHQVAEGLPVDPWSASSGFVNLAFRVEGALTTVGLPPAIIQQPSSLTRTQSSIATFSATANGDGPISYQWRFDGVPITGATSGNHAVSGVEVSDAGRYDIVVSNPYGSVTSVVATLSVRLLSEMSRWRFTESGAELGTFWREQAYDDSAWPAGMALLYAEDSPLPWTKNTPLTLGRTTYYFRNRFWVPEGPTPSVIRIRQVVDDGVVLYLNGLELVRTRMPDGPVIDSTWAIASVGDAVEEGPFEVAVSNVVVGGENVLAAEVHQWDPSSSDVVFGLTLDVAQNSVLPPVIVQQPPVEQTVVEGGAAVVKVEARGTPPLSYQWRRADSGDLIGATNANLVLTNISLSGGGYFYVVVSNLAGSTVSALSLVNVTQAPVTLQQPFLAASQFAFQLQAAAGRSYSVEASINLRDWESVLTTNAQSTGLSLLRFDLDSSAQRFFRVRSSP